MLYAIFGIRHSDAEELPRRKHTTPIQKSAALSVSDANKFLHIPSLISYDPLEYYLPSVPDYASHTFLRISHLYHACRIQYLYP